MKSVVQEWVSGLTLKQQTVLLSALRGCDGKPKEDVSKPLTRAFRGTILHSADPGNRTNPTSFMGTDKYLVENRLHFLNNLDPYPVHWLMHFAHACEIVGYKHPDKETRIEWQSLYEQICLALHVAPELEEELDRRLQDFLNTEER